MTDPTSPASATATRSTAVEGCRGADRLSRDYRIIRWGLVLTLALSCAVFLAFNPVDPDLWGHVKYGQEVLADGSLPATATHTYTAIDYRWINHENLTEIVLALVYEHFGVVGLTAGKCLLGICILGLMWWTSRRVVRSAGGRIDPLAMWAFLFLVTLNLEGSFLIRPQLFSFVLCAVMLVLLDRGFPDSPGKLEPRFGWLWCLPPLIVVWINFHGGVVAGVCILGAHLGGRAIELVVRSWKSAGGQSSRGAYPWRTVGHLALVAVASLAATFVNPYGYKLPRWLAQSLSLPRPEVTEWAMLSPSSPAVLPFVLLCVLVLVAFLFGRRPRDWTQYALFVLVGWQAAAHFRHIAFFALLCGFWLPGMLVGVSKRLSSGDAIRFPEIALAPWLRRTVVAALAIVVCLQTVNLAGRVRELPVHRNFYPVDALAYMAGQGLEGRLVVSFNWAQYALAALAPDVQLQFDGRYDTCYPPQAIDWHFDFLLGEHEGQRFRFPESGPLDGTKVLTSGDPHLVLVDRTYPAATANMEQEIAASPQKWVLLYQDGIAQLYGRSDRYDDPQSPHFVPPPYRIVTDVTQDDSVPWPALPARGFRRFAYR
jgi:hypothetical protein